MRFFPVEKDERGKNRTVLCTLRWITAEKEAVLFIICLVVFPFVLLGEILKQSK